MLEEDYYALVCDVARSIEQLHPEWNQDKVYTEAVAEVNATLDDEDY